MSDILADNFNGDNEKLIASIEASIKLSAAGALVPHGLSNNSRDMLAAAAVRLRAHAPELRSCGEPPLTCPAIDAFIRDCEPSDEVVQDLENIRDANSQLRYGLWSEKERANELQAELDKLRAVQSVPDARNWISPVATVADLVSNLLTLDQDNPVYGAYFLPEDVKDRCRVRNLTISKERVENGRIHSGNADIPYSTVIWTALEPERSTASNAEPAMWQWRNHIYRTWTRVETSIEDFRSAHAKVLETGQMEVRPLYAEPCTATGLWQDIRTAPTYETILVAGGDAIYPVTACWDGDPQDGWYVDGQEDTHVEIGWPTHWMPLPAPPVSRNERGGTAE